MPSVPDTLGDTGVYKHKTEKQSTYLWWRMYVYVLLCVCFGNVCGMARAPLILVQLKMVSVRSEKPIITRITPSLRRFPNVAFETVPKFV